MGACILDLDVGITGGGGPSARPVAGSSPATPAEAEELARAAASDAALARRAARGDRRAFSALYERFAPAVHAVLLGLVPAQDARDLVQEVFLSALDGLEGLAEPERVGPWLFAIARNRGRDHLRTRRRTLELDELAPTVEPRGDDEEAEEAALALASIRALPEAYRETLLLRLVEGLSGPEIAARTGLTHGSVRVNLHRGMKLLREALAGRLGGGGAA